MGKLEDAAPFCKLYLSMRISPLGFRDDIIFDLHAEKPEPTEISRGEGQVLIFELVDMDISMNFKAGMIEHFERILAQLRNASFQSWKRRYRGL